MCVCVTDSLCYTPKINSTVQIHYTPIKVKRDLPGGSGGKESACKAGDVIDLGLIPGSGRSSTGGNGNPLQYSCLGNPMDKGAWWTIVHGVAKNRTQLSDWTCTKVKPKTKTTIHLKKKAAAAAALHRGHSQSTVTPLKSEAVEDSGMVHRSLWGLPDWGLVLVDFVGKTEGPKWRHVAAPKRHLHHKFQHDCLYAWVGAAGGIQMTLQYLQ